MPGPAPKLPHERRRANKPEAGEWRHAPGVGWQHGEVPKPPPGLLKASKEAWETWFGAWFAAFWLPEDLPGLRTLIKLYDQVERNPEVASLQSQLRQAMAAYGVTPEGQQKRRWLPPADTPYGEESADAPKRRHRNRREASLEVIQGGA